MIGKTLTGKELMASLSSDMMLSLTVVPTCGLYNNAAIILNKTLYVSESAYALLQDKTVYSEVFKGLQISI